MNQPKIKIESNEDLLVKRKARMAAGEALAYIKSYHPIDPEILNFVKEVAHTTAMIAIKQERQQTASELLYINKLREDHFKMISLVPPNPFVCGFCLRNSDNSNT